MKTLIILSIYIFFLAISGLEVSPESQQLNSNFEAIATIFGIVVSVGLTIVIFILKDIKTDQRELKNQVSDINTKVGGIALSDAVQEGEIARLRERIKILEGFDK